MRINKKSNPIIINNIYLSYIYIINNYLKYIAIS